MIGLSIALWFSSVIMLALSVSLLRGNTSALHGRVFEHTEDKIGYAKAMGKPILLLAAGMTLSGITAVALPAVPALIAAGAVLAVTIAIVLIWSANIQRKFMM